MGASGDRKALPIIHLSQLCVWATGVAAVAEVASSRLSKRRATWVPSIALAVGSTSYAHAVMVSLAALQQDSWHAAVSEVAVAAS
jgi:hypothetical protein